MCTIWMFKKLAKLQGDVMCKCSYIVNEQGSTTTNKNNRRKKVLASSSNSSTTNPGSSRRPVSTTSSPRRSQALDSRWVPTRDEARILLPQIKRGKLKRRVTIGSNQSASSGSGDVDEPDWPPFADEDYIVFCFEEDGAFHVVMEDSPKTPTATKVQCEFHGNVSCACVEDGIVGRIGLTSRRDCLLTNQEGDEEEQLSPKLQEKESNLSNVSLEIEKDVVRKESTESLECINGSVESTDSSGRVDWEENLHDENETTLELEVDDFSSSPMNLLLGTEDDGNDDNAPHRFRIDSLLPDTLFEGEEEDEEIFLSPKSELGIKLTIKDLLKGDNDDSCTVSEESRGSNVKDNHGDDELIEIDEIDSESAKSSVSNQSNSCSSFEFPVLQWEWIDSPVTWPKQRRLHHFRKQKSKPSCLKCCKF